MTDTETIAVSNLGPCEVHSPLRSDLRTAVEDTFVSDTTYVRMPIEIDTTAEGPSQLFEKAGPRQKIFFEPSKTKAAIVTCGGLCPGLNNVIRSLYLQLHFHYGVNAVLGIRYGYSGFAPECGASPVWLNTEMVNDIHQRGGTLLGSSRGPVSPDIIVDFLEQRGINILFAVGGDGTQRGAHGIVEEVGRRKLRISIIGIPKTIDDDVMFVNRSFGYFTAIARAKDIIDSAHVEAHCALNGISIVKVMGRDSGFIAAGATLASQEVNFALVPESPFKLEGERGLLAELHRRLLERHHALIVVAEGAGQDLMPPSDERDASGNIKHRDIGSFLKEKIAKHFAKVRFPVVLRYIDPSYYIRSVPASTVDSVMCDSFARHAVHAAMAGKTDIIIGLQHGMFIHVPIPMATVQRKRLSAQEWASVVTATGQSDLV
ncbi:MAG TPA: ATP-dependent 6-phosphofructokinase [Candidatus Eisenbacteria bacterium]|nr:ATP-dependent 6-phosphofructokinase [Candidatus Eisenbacteria bacterium]